MNGNLSLDNTKPKKLNIGFPYRPLFLMGLVCWLNPASRGGLATRVRGLPCPLVEKQKMDAFSIALPKLRQKGLDFRPSRECAYHLLDRL